MDGYIKLYRKTIENGWLKNADLWRFWCYCLLKATHKKTTVVIGWQQVELEPGQFIFGRRVAAKEIQMTEQTIRTCLKNLENMKNLTIKSTNKYSLITIMNWATYQMAENESNPQTNPSLTHAQPTPNHLQEHNKRRSTTTVSFDYQTGEFIGLNGKVEIWAKAYPAIDVVPEIKKAGAWLIANPKNKKSDYPRFLNGWLSRAQDRAPKVNSDAGPFKSAYS